MMTEAHPYKPGDVVMVDGREADVIALIGDQDVSVAYPGCVAFSVPYTIVQRIETTGPRSKVTYQPPLNECHGHTRTWRRTLRGVPHEFTAVIMPNGERRYFAERYNGYGDNGTAEGRASGMRFACAWSPVASWTVKPALVLSWEAARGRPVVDVPAPSAEVLSGAYEAHHEHRPIGEYGVIVHRTRVTVHGEGDEITYATGTTYQVATCTSAEYRDNVLVPFHGYYDSTIRIERFGPDLDA